MAGEKRSQDYEDARDEKIIIVDIEGTTTSISFVKDTLFPYVRNNLKDYIEKNWENAEFKEDVKKLKEMATKDAADKIEGFVPITDSTTDEEKESLMKNILWQMDNDRKSGGLKQLQGHMWRDAYKSGAVKGHVYEDVPKSLEAWTKDNRKIYVYSSGSVEAQKLLFENTENGSLLKYFTDYYDTEIGEKQQTSSYKNILTKIDTEGKNVLFLTDVTKEAQAAIDAGMSSVIVIREGNAELTSEEKNKFTTIKSFDDLSFKTSAKRVKIDDTIEAEKNDTKVVTDETKKTDKVETTTTATTTDVEMKDVSTSNVEKKENKEDDKPKEEPMQVETKITKVDDVVTKKEEEKEVKKNDTPVVKNDTSVVKIDEIIEKKNDKVEEPVVKASTSEVKSIEKETTTTTTTPTKKITTEETTKKDTVVVDDKKIDENTQVQKKSETTSQKSTEENKSDNIEKTVEKIIVETEETKTKTEIEVKKIEVEKTNNDTTVKTVETTKTEETNDKKDKKDDDIVEKVKSTDEKIADKPITEEVKQNGDSKKSTDKNETTTTTTTTTTTPTVTVTETETKVPETTKVTNGQKTELNGDSKKVETIEKKETEVKVASVNNETTTSTTTTTAKTDDEPAKIESAKKEEDEKPKNDDEKQRVNGNTDDKNDKTHQNGVNEEKSKNGESSTDTESFKVKKVVEIIADGAGEAEVAPPVAVVAATS